MNTPLNRYGLRRCATKYPVFLLALSVLTFTPSFRVLIDASRYDEKRLLELMVVWLMLTLIVLSRSMLALTKTGTHALYVNDSKAAKATLSLTLLWSVIGILFSNDPFHSTQEVTLLVSLFIFSVYVAGITGTVAHATTWIATTAALAIFIYAIDFLSSIAAAFVYALPPSWPEPFTGFDNVRFFNQFQVFTFGPICLLLIIAKNKNRQTIFYFSHITLALSYFMLFASGSRGAFIAAAAGLLIASTVFRRQSKSFIRAQLVAASTGTILYILIFVIAARTAWPSSYFFGAHLVATRSAGRIELWQYAIDLIVQHPLFGVGPQGFANLGGPIAAHPHNSLLQIASEWGIPGAALLLFLIGVPFIKSVTYWSRTPLSSVNDNCADRIAVLSSFVSGSVYSLVSGVIVMPLSQLWLAISFGTMIGLLHNDMEQQQDNSSAREVGYRERVLIRFGAAALLALSFYSTWPEALPRIMDTGNGVDTLVPNPKPRFWRDQADHVTSSTRHTETASATVTARLNLHESQR